MYTLEEFASRLHEAKEAGFTTGDVVYITHKTASALPEGYQELLKKEGFGLAVSHWAPDDGIVRILKADNGPKLEFKPRDT